MATSEIEKLERRYAENPHGLTFAPLAEVHRKNGDIARALELLTAGLELHPNYIPASIVLGRCHQDAGDLPAAEAAFAHVLRLDDENVIALKSLADINERLERYDLAENWLRQLVQVDRNNDEAIEQLRRIEAARQSEVATAGRNETSEKEAPQTQPDEEEAAAAAVPPSSPVLEIIDLASEPAAPTTLAADPAPEPLPVDLAALEFSAAPAAAPAKYELPSPVQERDAQEATAAPAEMESVAPAEESAAEPAIPAPAEEPVTEETVQPLPGLISAEFQPPLQATGGLDVETSEEVVLAGSGNSEFRVPDASEDFKFLAARLAEPPPSPAAEPAEAREVTAEVQEPLPKAPAEPPQKRRSYLARDTNGQSVASFFQALLSARPPSEPGTADLASRGSPAGSGSSSNGGRLPGSDNEGVPAPPAVPSGEPHPDAAVSFDDFFSPEPGGSSSVRQGKSDPGGDDLDQFQSWLENLKR